MKKILSCMAGILLLAGSAFAQTPVTYMADNLVSSTTGSQIIDKGTTAEAIARSSAGYRWGGYADATTGNQIILVAPSARSLTSTQCCLGFNANTVKPGTRAYTRFDTNDTGGHPGTDSTISYTNSAISVNATGGEMLLNIQTNTHTDLKMGVLVYDNTNWWESNGAAIPTGGDNSAGYVTDIMLNSLTWTQVDTTSSGLGGAAMALVQAGDDLPPSTSLLTNGVTGTPNLATVSGIGLIMISSAQTSAVNIMDLAFGQVPSPQNVHAQAQTSAIALNWDTMANASSGGYLVYRSTTTGGPYTKVATPTTNSYSDTAVTSGTTYYYIVRGMIDHDGVGVTAYTYPSAASSEVNATAGNVSEVKNWIRK